MKHILVLLMAIALFAIPTDLSAQSSRVSKQERAALPDTVLNCNSKYIAVFGDMQIYFAYDSYVPYYQGALDWIANHSDRIAFCLHTGDITNDNLVSQWNRFYNATEQFTSVMPFYSCIGNHDYYCNATNPWCHRDSTRFSNYVGFPSTVSHIVSYFEPGKYENVVVREQLDGEVVNLLLLEMEPRTPAVKWADEYVKAHADENFILVTHRYMSAYAKRHSNPAYMTDTVSKAGQYVWKNLVYNNDNIRCVLCGHVSSRTRVLYSTNSQGRIVPQIEFNIQHEPHGGNGLIQLWEFPKDDDNVYIRTFNAYQHKYVTDSITEYQFKYR